MRKIAWRTFCSLALVTGVVAQQVPDFSGEYVLKSSGISDSRRSAYTGNVIRGRLVKKVVQNQDSIKITLEEDKNGEVTREYRLDGHKIRGEEPDGTPTLEWAEIKGKELIIRSSLKVASGALKGVPTIRTQKWEISKDLKTVTIRERLQAEGLHVRNDLVSVT